LVNDGNDKGGEAQAFNYDILVEEALKNVVKKVLKSTSEEGLFGNSHFFISFNGDFPEVTVPSELKSEDNSEIKIIIQHQFWDLISTENHFEVTLSFNGKKKKISIPYDAITSFTDPSVGFGLQFKTQNPESILNTGNNEKIIEVSKKDNNLKNETNTPSGEIVSLDEFRDKK
jgi:hypothetical protein